MTALLLICAAYLIGWTRGSIYEMQSHSRWLKQHLGSLPKLPEEM